MYKRVFVITVTLLLFVSAVHITGAIAQGERSGEREEQSAMQAAKTGANTANPFVRPRWSPYAVGIGIGILSWIAFVFSSKPIGISTAYAKSAGMIEKVFRGSGVEQKAYYQKFKPGVDWEWMLVIGVIVGAFLSSFLSGEFAFVFLPEMWRVQSGDTVLLRFAAAFAGGSIMGIGARWAGGCTSGHGISGTLQLAVSSWVAVAAMFVGGVATAHLLMGIL